MNLWSNAIIRLMMSIAKVTYRTRLLAVPFVRMFVMKVYQSFLYPLVLRRIFHLEHIAVKIGKNHFYAPLVDGGGLGLASFGGTLDTYMANLFKRVVRPGMTVVDIGAYIGYYTIIAAHLVGEGGRVYAFEPDPDNYGYLVRNIEINGCTNVIPIQKAVSDHAGASAFFLDRYNSTCHSLYPILRTSGVKQICVECVPLDDLLASESIQVIKMDIEGAELAALQGMKYILANNPALTLFIELQPNNLSRAGKTAVELLLFLKGQGFDTFLIDEQKHTSQPITQDALLRGSFHREQNLLCIRGKKFDSLPGIPRNSRDSSIRAQEGRK